MTPSLPLRQLAWLRRGVGGGLPGQGQGCRCGRRGTEGEVSFAGWVATSLVLLIPARGVVGLLPPLRRLQDDSGGAAARSPSTTRLSSPPLSRRLSPVRMAVSSEISSTVSAIDHMHYLLYPVGEPRASQIDELLLYFLLPNGGSSRHSAFVLM
jgi:hypothetical protein